jgi:membrane-bound metal-dependent hydrolase YbcI (DUF457 family)
MIFIHAPAGYLIGRLAGLRLPTQAGRRALLAWGVLGGLAPDFDLFWTKYVDHWAAHHHRYITHWPLFWIALLAGLALVLWRRQASGTAWNIFGVFSAGVVSHLFFDWMVSPIWLLEPFSSESFQLIHVHANYRSWFINYLFHWTAWIDVGIATLGTLTAYHDVWFWWERRRRGAGGSTVQQTA